MARGAATFKLSDLTRALKAAKAAGIPEGTAKSRLRLALARRALSALVVANTAGFG